MSRETADDQINCTAHDHGRSGMTLTPEERARVDQRREQGQYMDRLLPHLDPGIAHYVDVLRRNGVETYESCQGGPDHTRPGLGHAYPEPTVRFHGTQAAGWWAVQVCLDHGFPVQSLSRIWTFEGTEPTGPSWQLVFRHDALARMVLVYPDGVPDDALPSQNKSEVA